MRAIAKFFKDAGYHGGGSVIVAVILFGVTIWEHAHNKAVGAWWLWALVVFTFGYGAVVAWHKEYKAGLVKDTRIAQLESANASRPEIRGHASNFMTEGPLLNSMSAGAKSAAFTLKFDLNLCNHRQVPTNLQDITLTGTIYGHISHFSEMKFDHADLLYGIAANLQVAAIANVYSLGLEDLKGKWLNLDNIRIYAVDGFGGRHQIGMREGEEILVL